jgi:hypothetical protein
MATRAQIERLTLRIEALARSEESHLVVVDPSETDEQALARHQRDLGPIRGGTIYLIRTGVPRALSKL